MKSKTIKIGTVHQCNCYMGSKTLHPLVSVIDLSDSNLTQQNIKLGFYAVLLRECRCGDFLYGRQYYDYSDGTLLFLTPGETIAIDNCLLPQKGRILAFHPDLIGCTSLGQNIQDYSFFSYHKNEALHISAREKQKVLECFDNIREELQHAIDCHSKTLITKYIELLLDYCIRFNERQFITRCEANKKLLTKFEKILNEYFEADRVKRNGLPSAEYCADLLQLSPSYFMDLLKYETGKNIKEHIQFKRIEIARQRLQTTHKTVNQIADELGYSSVQYFTRLFTKIAGCSPNEYRHPN